MSRSPTFLRPRSLDEAVEQLVEYAGDARVLAGSTALTIMLRQGLIEPAALVMLAGIAGLDEIVREDGHVKIGALVTHRGAERSEELAGSMPVLADTFAKVANVRVRNQATVGGVLAEADYASDPPAVFVGLGAEIEAYGPDGARAIPAGEFFRAFYETALEPNEVLTAVRVPVLAPGTAAVYKKYVSRSSEDRPCVGVFASAGPEGVRVVVGAAAETPQRFPELEERAAGGLDSGSIAAVADGYAE